VQSCNRPEIHVSAANVLVGYGIRTTPQNVKWALLTPGSEANCISENLAHKLGAIMESEPGHEHRTELKTADGTPLEYLGRTKLGISWLSRSGLPRGDDLIGEAKIKYYVVSNLQDDVVLSEATIRRHELRDAAPSSLNYMPAALTNTVAPIKFNRCSGKARKMTRLILKKKRKQILSRRSKNRKPNDTLFETKCSTRHRALEAG
jgi:hypothetical protein